MATKTSSPVLTPGVRRSATVSTRIQQQASSPSPDASPESRVETLFAHPSVRIVSFSAPAPTTSPSTPGTLPWKSRTEQVVAVGPLHIYRLKGSVAFLHSGGLLLSLLPRSQCWCVDGVSKFAMRIQLFYRIELPCESDEDQARVEELKGVFEKVLRYEKTACPFKRSFAVDLPEETPSPTIRKMSTPTTKARKWEFDKRWKPEGWEHDEEEWRGDGEEQRRNIQGTRRASSTADQRTTPPRSEGSSTAWQGERRPSVSVRARRFETARSVTAPLPRAFDPAELLPQESKDTSVPLPHENSTVLQTTPPDSYPPPPTDAISSCSGASSLQSFHTVKSTLTTSPPSSRPTTPPSIEPESPQTPQQQSHFPKQLQEKPHQPLPYSTSSKDITSDWAPVAAPPLQPSPSTTPPHRRPSPTQHSPPNPTLSRDRSRYYHTPSSSPTTAAASLHTKPRSSSPSSPPQAAATLKPVPQPATRSRSPLPSYLANEDPLPTALLSKTCALLLGPPSGLVQVMMQIAVMIAKSAREFGENAARAYRVRRRRRRRMSGTGGENGGEEHSRRGLVVPGGWEDSDSDGEVEWIEDGSGSEGVSGDEWGYAEEVEDGGRNGNGSSHGVRKRAEGSAVAREMDVD